MKTKKKNFLFWGSKLKYLRDADSISQAQLARELETTRNTISNLERGIHQPTVEILMRIMQYFQLEIDEIVYEV
jgi:putative transcriptional regulator